MNALVLTATSITVFMHTSRGEWLMIPTPGQTGQPYVTQESAASVQSRAKEGRSVLMKILGTIAAIVVVVLFVWLLFSV